VLRTVAYSDVFDFPLTREEIFRYCVSPAGSRADLEGAIDALLAAGRLCSHDAYVTLPGRASTVLTRHRLAASSARHWPAALRWGTVLWSLPFVRMVAVTGSLAANACKEEGDVDYLIVVEPGRLWLTRALCLAVWRLAQVFGARLCPNYLITTRALGVEQRNLYTARELVQMRPLHGRAVAAGLRDANRWSHRYLPNADLEVDPTSDAMPRPVRLVKQSMERLLSSRAFGLAERWEQERKIAQLVAQLPGTRESAFSAHVCKDHAHAHGSRVLALYAGRLRALGQLEHEESPHSQEWPVPAE
jgi:hypothetical protein